ncbi:hypothetical protein [Kribbella sp. NPDC023855]|uniref:hypothetical protein n=1 Tax=Kribbella sp. NPDC023855 TaxID=3154698 RepID=UPI0033E18F63
MTTDEVMTMAKLDFDGHELRIRFSAVERWATWRREVRVPLAAVRSAEVVAAPLRSTRGGRVGFLISGVLKIGRWGLGTGMRQLVSVRRGVPGLLVKVDETAGFDELLISTDRADELAAALTSRVGR